MTCWFLHASTGPDLLKKASVVHSQTHLSAVQDRFGQSYNGDDFLEFGRRKYWDKDILVLVWARRHSSVDIFCWGIEYGN